MNQIASYSESFVVPEGTVMTLQGSTTFVTVRVETVPGLSEIWCEASSNFLSSEELRQQFRFWQQDSAVHFDGYPSVMIFSGRKWIRLEFKVPEGTNLEIGASSGSIKLDGSYGEVAASASSGTIRLDRAAGANLTTSSGTIKVGQVGNILAKASSGTVSVDSSTGSTVLEASSGTVRAGAVQGEGRMNTHSGSIRLGHVDGSYDLTAGSGSVKVESLYRGALRIETGSGSQKIGVAAGTAVMADARSRVGNVRSSLSVTDPSSFERTAQVFTRAGVGSIRFDRA